jgi:hypothetical protein
MLRFFCFRWVFRVKNLRLSRWETISYRNSLHWFIHPVVCFKLQVHSLFRSHLSTQCDLVLPLWIYSVLSFTYWLRAGRSAIECRRGRHFPPVQTGSGAHPASCKMGTGSFPGVKCGRGLLPTTHPLLVPRSWKSRAIPLPTLWATPGL